MNNIIITFANAIDPTSGGVERVYHNLTQFFISRGFNVYATYQIKSDYNKHTVYTACYYMDVAIGHPQYKVKLDNLISRLNIDIAICPFTNFELYDYFSRKTSLKVFFHIHNVPSELLSHSISKLPPSLKGTLVDNLTKNIRKYIRFNSSFRRIDKHEMKLVILSDAFKKNLLKVHSFNVNNIITLPNPFLIDNTFSINSCVKEKIILYVGRINTRQKRFQSLLNIWSILQKELPEYRMDILGGGPEKEYYESKAKEMGLNRIIFHGFEQPNEYYKRAEVLCMTSNYEGFGMVLVEAMQYGCVPFAFNSFGALQDIIDDGINGFRITPFNEKEYAEKVVQYLSSSLENRNKLQRNAIKKSKMFDINIIGKKWIEMFSNYEK